MEAERKCVKCLKGVKIVGDECAQCILDHELNLENSPPSNEQNSEQTDDQLSKNKTLAPVNAAADEPQVEQTARQVPRANENGVVSNANALQPEYPKIFEQLKTTVNTSNFGVCPTSEGICESQSVAIQDQIMDSTVETAVSVSRSEPEPSISGYSGQKRKRKPNTDSEDAKKNSRAKKRKANESQDKKRYNKGVCQECNGKECGNIYTHLSTHKNRAQKSEDQDEKNYVHKVEKKNGVKTLVRAPKTDGQMEEPRKIYECDCAQFSTYLKGKLEDHIVNKHFPKTIKCDYCPKLFATEKNLRRHVKKCHAIKWECHVCNRRMTYNQKSKHKHPVKPNGKKI